MLYVTDIRAIRAYCSALGDNLEEYSDEALKEILFQYRWSNVRLTLDAINRWQQYDSLQDAAKELVESSDYFTQEEYVKASYEKKEDMIYNILTSLDYEVTSVVENGTKYWLISEHIEEEEN